MENEELLKGEAEMPEHNAVPAYELESPSGPALPDLDTLVTEIGASYPMLAHAAQVDEEGAAGAYDALILAGLVTP